MEPPTYPQLAERLKRINPDAKALWGKMNLAQMLAHCRLPIESSLGERRVALQGNFFKLRILFPILMKIPWPKGKAQTHTEFDVVRMDLPVRSVQAETSALAAKLDLFLAEGFQPKEHPIFGELTLAQWMHLQRKHLDHHLRQFGA